VVVILEASFAAGFSVAVVSVFCSVEVDASSVFLQEIKKSELPKRKSSIDFDCITLVFYPFKYNNLNRKAFHF
jgi:hypothetical protein